MTQDMAEAQNLEWLECPVCFESMVEKRPLVLSCLHTFCTPCVRKLYKNKSVLCPTCRAETKVKDGDISKLPLNRDLLQYFEREIKSKKDLGKWCEFCFMKGLKNQSIGLCTDCVKKMCRGCIQKHRQLAVFKGHKIASKLRAQEPEGRCGSHGELLQYVCMECLQTLCVYCASDERHADHADLIEKIDTGIKILREKRRQQVAIVNEAMKKLTCTRQIVTSDLQAVNKSKEDLKELRLLFKSKLSEVDKFEEQVSRYEASICKSESMVCELIGEAQCRQNYLKAEDNYSDDQFLTFLKTASLDKSLLHGIDQMCHNLLDYKIPKFERNKYLQSGSKFSQTPIGKMTKLTPTKYFPAVSKQPEKSKEEKLPVKADARNLSNQLDAAWLNPSELTPSQKCQPSPQSAMSNKTLLDNQKTADAPTNPFVQSVSNTSDPPWFQRRKVQELKQLNITE